MVLDPYHPPFPTIVLELVFTEYQYLPYKQAIYTHFLKENMILMLSSHQNKSNRPMSYINPSPRHQNPVFSLNHFTCFKFNLSTICNIPSPLSIFSASHKYSETPATVSLVDFHLQSFPSRFNISHRYQIFMICRNIGSHWILN